jgi:ParB family chromosome partitioning protein
MEKAELKNIPLEKLIIGKYQTRKDFDQVYIQELAESIKENGIIQPIIVRPVEEGDYEIIAGECRWRAAQLASLDLVPCLVRKYTDEQAIAATTIENLQRRDLNPIEEAKAYQQFVEKFDYLHEEIAAVIGKSRTKITNSLRLLRLDNRVQAMLESGELSDGHGKVIAGLPQKIQYEVAEKCATQDWSVRKLEHTIKLLQQRGSAIKHQEDPNIMALEKIISDQIGSEIKFEQNLNKRGGWLKIRYFNNETLAGILDKMDIKYNR